MENKFNEDLIKKIAEDIFTDGNGRKATRLIMEFDGKTDGTGRNQISVEGVIRKHLSKGLADMGNIDRKIKGSFECWMVNLGWYMLRKGDDIAAYNLDSLRKLFTSGYTTRKAYSELQSDKSA